MRSLMFTILFMLYFISTFNRGLYFDKDIYGIHIIIYILFIILIIRFWVRKEISNVFHFTFLLMLPILHIFSFFYAASPYGAINLALRWMTYISFFLLLFWSAQETKWIRNWFPILFQFSGIGIALHMYFNSLGWIESTSAFILGRFAGTFQYPNTFGMVIGVFIIVSITLLASKKLSKIEVLTYTLPLSLYFYLFVGSLSRGMFIILPIILLLLLFLKNIKNQVIILSMVVTNILFTLISVVFELNNAMNIGLLIIFSILSYIIYQLLYTKVDRFDFVREQSLFKKIMIPIAILISSTALVFDLLFQGLVFRFLPSQLQETLLKLNESSTFRERMLFNEDSFSLGKESFLFGHGGNSWPALYPKVQQLPYRSKTIHNGLMEVFVDIGFIGLFIYLSTFSLLIYFVYINWKQSEQKAIHLAVLLSIITIFLHSLLDFNQTFGTIWFITFTLFAISLTREYHWQLALPKFKHQISNKNKKMILSLFTVPIFIGIFYSFQLIEAEKSHVRASHSDRLDEQIYHLKTAAHKNKFNTIYVYEYGRKLLDTTNNEHNVIAISKQLASLEPKNPKTMEMAAILALLAENEKLALTYYIEGIKLDNFDKKMHERVFQILMNIKSIENAEKVTHLFEQIQKDYDTFVNNPIGSAHNSREFEITDRMMEFVSTAYYILEDEKALNQLIDDVADDEIQAEIIAKTMILLEKRGNTEEIHNLEGKHHEQMNTINEKREFWQDK